MGCLNQIDLGTTRDAQTLYSECYHKYVCMGCIQSNCLYGLFPVKLFSSDKGYNHTVHSEWHHKDVYWVYQIKALQEQQRMIMLYAWNAIIKMYV